MIRLCLLTLLACSVSAAQKSDLRTSLVSDAVVFAEEGGTLALEAEHFSRQTFAEKRAWYVTSSETVPDVRPDGDPSHVAGASGGAYVEALPDTRRTHGDRLVTGENFSNLPGRLAVLHYKVHFSQPGRYYVWARTWSTGSEDNGLHFGLDGTWPASGQRWQTVRKNGWSWECRRAWFEHSTPKRSPVSANTPATTSSPYGRAVRVVPGHSDGRAARTDDVHAGGWCRGRQDCAYAEA